MLSWDGRKRVSRLMGHMRMGASKDPFNIFLSHSFTNNQHVIIMHPINKELLFRIENIIGQGSESFLF